VAFAAIFEYFREQERRRMAGGRERSLGLDKRRKGVVDGRWKGRVINQRKLREKWLLWWP